MIDPAGLDAPVLAACPWRSLSAYTSDDAQLFFGRSRACRQLDSLVRRSRFVTVIGASGSGKSSLAAAGLASTGWRVHVLDAGRGVDQALVAFERSPLSADDATVLVVDQMESMFRDVSHAEREALFDQLLDLAAAPDGAPVVCVLRSDRYGDCAAHGRLADAISAAHLLLGEPGEADLRSMILEPAALHRLTIDADLVDDIVDDLLGEPGALPLLSHALVETWLQSDRRHIGLADYRAVGGARGSIARVAERAWSLLSERQATIARGILLDLADPSSPALDSGRPLPVLDDVVDGRDRAVVVQQLAASRILTVDGGWMQVGHEAVFREWPRLRGWLDHDRVEIRAIAALDQQADTWNGEGRPTTSLLRGVRLDAAAEVRHDRPDRLNDLTKLFVAESEAQRDLEAASAATRSVRDRRRARVLRGLLVASCTALVVALAATGVALVQRNDANETRFAARIDSLIGRSLTTRSSQRDLAMLLALEADRLTGGDVRGRSALLAAFTYDPGYLGAVTAPEAFTSVTGELLPDGDVLVANDATHLQVGSLDDLASFGPVIAPPVTGSLIGEELRVSPDAGWAALVTEHPDGSSIVSMRDLTTGSWSAPIVLAHQSVNTAFSADGALLAIAGGPDAATVIYRLEHGAEPTLVATIEGLLPPDASFTYYTAAVAFAPNGRLVIGYEAAVLRVVDTESFEVVAEIDVPDHSFNRDLTFSTDGNVLLGVGSISIGNVSLVDWPSGDVRWALGLTDLGVTGCSAQAIDIDRDRLWCADYYGRLSERDLATGARTGVELVSQIGRVGRLAIAADGATLVAFGADQPEISRWRLDGSGPITRRFAPGQFFGSFSSDGRYVTSGTADPDAPNGFDDAVLDAETGAVVDPLDEVVHAEWSDDPDQLFVLRRSDDRWEIVRYDVARHQVVDGFAISTEDEPTRMQPFGSLLVTATAEGRFRVYDAATGEALSPVLELAPDLISIARTADGERLITMGPAGSSLIDIASGTVVDGPTPVPNYGVVSPGDELIGSDFGGSVEVYDATTLQPIRSLSDGAGLVQEIRIDRAGTVVAAKGGDRSVSVFDWPSGVQLGAAFSIPEDEQSYIQIAPDGRTLAVGGGSQAGTALWTLDHDTWRDRLCEVAGRNLTVEEWQRELGWSGDYRVTCPQFPSRAADAQRFDGTWVSSTLPAGAVDALLADGDGQQFQIELLLRDGRFRIRTGAGPRFDLASGSFTVSGNTITFTSDSSDAPHSDTVRLTASVDGTRLSFSGPADGRGLAALLLAATPLRAA